MTHSAPIPPRKWTIRYDSPCNDVTRWVSNTISQSMFPVPFPLVQFSTVHAYLPSLVSASHGYIWHPVHQWPGSASWQMSYDSIPDCLNPRDMGYATAGVTIIALTLSLRSNVRILALLRAYFFLPWIFLIVDCMISGQVVDHSTGIIRFRICDYWGCQCVFKLFYIWSVYLIFPRSYFDLAISAHPFFAVFSVSRTQFHFPSSRIFLLQNSTLIALTSCWLLHYTWGYLVDARSVNTRWYYTFILRS